MHCRSICYILLKCNKNLLKRSQSMKKGMEQKESCRKQRISLYPKVIRCVWWHWKCVVYYNHLPQDQTFNYDKYCSPLDRRNTVAGEKQQELVHGVVFRQLIIKPHVSLKIQQKLIPHGWDILQHSPFLYNLGFQIYPLFRSLEYFLNEKKFNFLEAFTNHLNQSTTQRDVKFWQYGILSLR